MSKSSNDVVWDYMRKSTDFAHAQEYSSELCTQIWCSLYDLATPLSWLRDEYLERDSSAAYKGSLMDQQFWSFLCVWNDLVLVGMWIVFVLSNSSEFFQTFQLEFWKWVCVRAILVSDVLNLFFICDIFDSWSFVCYVLK